MIGLPSILSATPRSPFGAQHQVRLTNWANHASCAQEPYEIPGVLLLALFREERQDLKLFFFFFIIKASPHKTAK